MKEFLLKLLQAAATAAVPVCAAFLIQFLQRKSAQIGAQTDSLTEKQLLAEVTDAVTTAVAYTSQTYVDALKKGGIFDKDAQAEALQKSLKKAVSLLSQSARSVLGEIYGDLNADLTRRIEAEVRKQKNEITAALPLVGELISNVETTVEETADQTDSVKLESLEYPVRGYRMLYDGNEVFKAGEIV